MKVVRLKALNLFEKKFFNRLDNKISKIQNRIIDFEVTAIKTIYKTEIDKINYKKYKLG